MKLKKSKVKNILFRSDSSSTIGTGHTMRDLVLAAQYKNAKINFATQALQGNINHKILEAGHNLYSLKSDTTKELIKLIQKLNIDLLVIDHYEIGFKEEQDIKKKTGVQILSLDDTYEKHHCDTLLNHNISADAKRYKHLVPKTCKVLCGAKYTLLREEFYKYKKKNYKRKTTNTKVLLAMGGADTAHLNIKILKSLKKSQNIEVAVVTTKANKNLKKLQNYVNGEKWIKLHVETKHIAKLMQQSDYAIITPSVILNEVIFMDLPFIAIKTASNQKEIYKYLQKNNYLCLKKFHIKDFQKKIELLNNLYHIQLSNFSSLSVKKKSKILKWRNHFSIRRWMHNKKIIKIKNHYNYINSLQKTVDKQYFLVSIHKRDIGVINLTNITKTEAEIGLYSKPNSIGYGKILMNTLLHYSFKTLDLKVLKLSVYKDNRRAREFYKKFHFITKKIGKKLIYMELYNDYR